LLGYSRYKTVECYIFATVLNGAKNIQWGFTQTFLLLPPLFYGGKLTFLGGDSKGLFVGIFRDFNKSDDYKAHRYSLIQMLRIISALIVGHDLPYIYVW
jgi:hypothetical protein